MSLLRELAKRFKAYKLHPGVHEYTDVYERQFVDRRHTVRQLLEIGVQSGGSLRMWAEYFPEASIHGIDCNAKCLAHATDRIHVHIGRQEDREFLRRTVVPVGPFDVIVDDGGHTAMQQQTSLQELWSSVGDGGTYVIEDLHTSYYVKAESRRTTTVEFLKGLIDGLNRKSLTAYARDRRTRPAHVPDPPAMTGLHAMHFYGCLCFLHKQSTDRWN